MKKFYKVIALSVSTLHGVKKHNEIVSETDFPEGHAEEQVKNGFLKAVTKSENEALNEDLNSAKAKIKKKQDEALAVSKENAEKAKEVKAEQAEAEAAKAAEFAAKEAEEAEAAKAAEEAAEKASKEAEEAEEAEKKAKAAEKKAKSGK